jgi:hypothetical protein
VPPEQDGDWARVGGQLSHRRVEIDPRYRNRRLFAEERGVNWRLLHDLERAKRTNFEPETLTAFEVAYSLVRGSFTRSLAGGELEPLPVEGQPPAGAGSPPLSPVADDVDPEALAPFIAGVWREVGAAVAEHHREDPAGAQIFDDPQEQRIWDSSGPLKTREEKVHLIALLRMLEDEYVNGQANGAETGLVRS